MSTYQRALAEFETEDENGKSRLIYAYFGLAIYKAQCIEQTFANMIWLRRIFERKVKTQQEVNEIIDSIESSKMTMGNLITEIKTNYRIDDIVTQNLKLVLEKRNYLAHKYFKLEIQKTYTDTGKREMLKYFGDFIDESTEVDQSLNIYYVNYMQRLGVTEERIQELIEEQKREEIGRVEKISTKGDI